MGSGPIYDFGPFRYDAGQRLLFREGELVPLMPKAIDTLHALVERRGTVVEKGELMKLVWPDTVVEEIGLARNISLLRKALGEEGEAAAYIETIPRRGYRFVAEVRESGAAAAGQAPPAVRRRRARLIGAGVVLAAMLGSGIYWQFYLPSRYLPAGDVSLAVVPLNCLTDTPACGQFAAAFEEQLLARLAQLGGIQVVGPSTVRRYRRFHLSMGLMGRILGLEVLVEGSVEHSDRGVHLTPRLVDVHTGRLIWAQTFAYAAGTEALEEAQAARAVAAAIGAHLLVHQTAPPESR
jgi:DNA-binding winged helix-turn-helix (wHTH) protein/TolB-like protein